MQHGGPAIGTAKPRVAHADIRSFEGVVPKSADWRALGTASKAMSEDRVA
jgi:phthalate 4,5-dioxygenase oxygenase subunit